ncbi:ImmA/IrrE family metallo-endopeptidase [Saccharothrix sp. 6-C]|uniref:XRE family transcriptional regulator n=1 Tax=Saccharothrix sp. 6-C TaxID=2781735 RepID=UPI001916D82E|nr:XRE family transcriptional regulator [Saccharothrix sp. 6-C]QQQ74216.1 ImmA/IrrE family metallo-endopeptidase [Saccharothrix sp. 6-C]
MSGFVAGDANPDLLVAAREALGWTQKRLAEELTRLAKADPEISQGYVSRAEKGSLTVAGERLELFASALGATPDLLVSDSKLWSLGEGCLYHRNRASTKASTLRRLHARINLLRLYLRRLAADSTVPLREFTLVPMRVGDIDGPEDAARALRRTLDLPDGPVESVTAIAEQVGALVVPMSLGGREVDATSLHPPGEAPVFVVNTDAPAERRRFTLAHELGHIACAPAPDMDVEDMAQAFAGELLAPAAQVRGDLRAAPITPARLLQLKAHWRMSAAALLRRAVDLAVITDSRYRTLNTQMSALGWKTGEPEPLPDEATTVVPALVAAAVRSTGGIAAAAAKAGTTAENLRAMLGDDVLGADDD